MAENLILVINPGSTSTKLGLYSGFEPVSVETVDHTNAGWVVQKKTIEQWEERTQVVREFLSKNGVTTGDLSAVAARGGLLRPVRSGAYMVNQKMLDDLRQEYGGRHASNLGGLVAWALAHPNRIPAFIVDPVSVDEFEDESRYSGLPGLQRRSLLHALNMKACAKKAARELGKPLDDMFLVLAHLGSGFSVSPCYKGRLVDVNNSNEEGPSTVERAGSLPSMYVMDLYFEENDPAKVKGEITGHSGMYGHLGTKDARLVEELAEREPEAKAVFEAMAYQVAKEIGAMASFHKDPVDAIVITGGLAKSKVFVEKITAQTAFIAPHLVYPGEDEIEALAHGVQRVLTREEPYRDYPSGEVHWL